MIDDDRTSYYELYTPLVPHLSLHTLGLHGVLDCPSYEVSDVIDFLCFQFASSSPIVGSSWERLLGHVCHTTHKQADAAPNILSIIVTLLQDSNHTTIILTSAQNMII